MKYQIFGERCSSSNFLKSLLEANFSGLIQCNDYGFKHWISRSFLEEKSFPPDLVFLLVVRNPYDWLRSLYVNPWHCAYHLRSLSFSEFIRSEWQCIWDEDVGIDKEHPNWLKEIEFERNPFSNKSFENVLDVRRVKYRL